jgi:hypothetical protein
MGSRLLPVSLTTGALLADVVGVHKLAYYLVLLAVVGAAAAAFVGVGDVLEGKGGLVRAASTVVALAFIVLGSAARAAAPAGGHVPVLAITAAVAALLSYLLPLLGWLVGPVAAPRRPARAERQAPQPVSP